VLDGREMPRREFSHRDLAGLVINPFERPAEIYKPTFGQRSVVGLKTSTNQLAEVANHREISSRC